MPQETQRFGSAWLVLLDNSPHCSSQLVLDNGTGWKQQTISLTPSRGIPIISACETSQTNSLGRWWILVSPALIFPGGTSLPY